MQTLSVEKGLVIQNGEVVKKVEADEDLKILARIRSKERMQATRKRRREEQAKQSGTRYNNPHILGKAVAKVKHNLPASSTKAVEFVKKLLPNFKLLYFTKMTPLKLCFEN
ncbi:hypothetical protein TNCT_564431 [Trichonephila clavata]|uniref:Uncharacterized protein n=1 Tax=Trichonephila clavata TaxID=2740835 RepID=A0A8X6GMS7_TRICU|nr:hypothetical protein TNCT_564431 [Trichonephila clavata]